MLHYLFTDRQTNSGPRIVFWRMEPIEEVEDMIRISGFDTDAIIAHGKLPYIVLLPLPAFRPDVDARRSRATKFKGVIDQVLENCPELVAVPHDAGQRVVRDNGSTLSNCRL
jgi:hypothetical protein